MLPAKVIETTNREQINNFLRIGPILLEFRGINCPSCNELKPILEELAVEYDGKATIMSAAAFNKGPTQLVKDLNAFNNSEGSAIVTPSSAVIVGVESGKYVYMKEDGEVTKDWLQAHTHVCTRNDKGVLEKLLNLALQK